MTEVHDAAEAREALARLTPQQRERLTARLRERRRSENADDVIPARPDPTAHPVSAAQERIWALSRLRPDSGVYNLHEARRLLGHVDVEILRRSFVQIIRRHETLRATFQDDGGRPQQHIRDADGFDLEVVDLQHMAQQDRLDRALDMARQEAERPFDLSADRLIRAKLIRLDTADHVLLLTVHHIVCDGWSLGIIDAELSELYRAYTAGSAETLAEPTLQYADFAHWQRQQADRTLRGQLDYWARRLAGDVRPVELPGSRQLPSRRSAAGGHHAFELSEETTTAVRRISQHHRTTPFITLMAAFQVLLHRYSGQEDLIVCSPVAGRTRRETERLVGYFNNLIVVRGDLSGDPTFEEVLTRMRPVVTGAFDHQDVPFQMIAALPNVASNPLTRALFVLQDTEDRNLSLPGVEVSALDVDAAIADFDLAFFMRQRADNLRGVVRFSAELFSHETVGAMVADFEATLSQILDEPAARLAQLPKLELAGTDDPPRPSEAAAPQVMGRPRTPLESQMRDIWEQAFSKRPIGVNDNFFDLGGHSLLAAELATEIEQRITGTPLPLAALFEAPTIAELANLISAGEGPDSWSSLVPIKPTGTRPPLFFVHAHGGNVIGYRDLALHIGADQPFYGLQAPDMAKRDAAIAPRRIPDMARRYLEEIREVQPHGPYFLGGWCLGGDVAYEMAVQLTAAGEDVPLVVMVDNPRPAHIETSLHASPVHRLANRIRTRLVMERDNLNEVTPRDKPRYIVDRIGRLIQKTAVRTEGKLAASFPSMRRSRALRLEEIAAAHEKAYAQYDPPPYGGRVALFRAARQPAGRASDPSLGWSAHITGALDIYDVAGHRIGLLSEPRVGPVAERMVAAMEQSMDSGLHSV